MPKFRRICFWIHFALGLITGAAAFVTAGTAVIMAFADSYLDLRDRAAGSIEPPPHAVPIGVGELAALVRDKLQAGKVSHVDTEWDPRRPIEFHHGRDGLIYLDLASRPRRDPRRKTAWSSAGDQGSSRCNGVQSRDKAHANRDWISGRSDSN